MKKNLYLGNNLDSVRNHLQCRWILTERLPWYTRTLTEMAWLSDRTVQRRLIGALIEQSYTVLCRCAWHQTNTHDWNADVQRTSNRTLCLIALIYSLNSC